jgi:hypothetical protein
MKARFKALFMGLPLCGIVALVFSCLYPTGITVASAHNERVEDIIPVTAHDLSDGLVGVDGPEIWGVAIDMVNAYLDEEDEFLIKLPRGTNIAVPDSGHINNPKISDENAEMTIYLWAEESKIEAEDPINDILFEIGPKQKLVLLGHNFIFNGPVLITMDDEFDAMENHLVARAGAKLPDSELIIPLWP